MIGTLNYGIRTKLRTRGGIYMPLSCVACSLKIIIRILTEIAVCTVRNIPNVVGGSVIRVVLYRQLVKSMGKHIRIDPGAIISGYAIECGSHVVFGRNIMINGEGGLEIGSNVIMGPGSFIWTANHDYGVDHICQDVKMIYKPIKICDNVWVCADTKIIPGVVIGKNSVCAMGAVVVKDVPPNTIVGGNPAIVIKNIIRREYEN